MEVKIVTKLQDNIVLLQMDLILRMLHNVTHKIIKDVIETMVFFVTNFLGSTNATLIIA